MKKRTRKVEPVVLVPEFVMTPESVTGVPIVAEVGEIDPAVRSACSAPVTAAMRFCGKPESERDPFEKPSPRPATTTTMIPDRARR
jgi:hypothetical protein